MFSGRDLQIAGGDQHWLLLTAGKEAWEDDAIRKTEEKQIIRCMWMTNVPGKKCRKASAFSKEEEGSTGTRRRAENNLYKLVLTLLW